MAKGEKEINDFITDVISDLDSAIERLKKHHQNNSENSIGSIITSLELNKMQLIMLKKSKIENWTKINHGGQKMPKVKDKKQYAVFIGRYQPYHYGHICLIEQKLKEGVPVLIMVRDLPADEKNPFTTEQTVKMIEKYHAAKGHDVKVKVIPDIESVNYGRGVGYEINEFIPPEDIGFISATKIRESIKTGDTEWKRMVDPVIQDDIVDYLKANDNLKKFINKIFFQ